MTETTDKIRVTVVARVERRKLVRGVAYDGRVGEVEATARTKPELALDLGEQLEALALHPQPAYRRLHDGRGLIARVTGAGEDGALTYALERYHPDGRSAGSELGAFHRTAACATDRVGVATLQSSRQEVGDALRRLVEHEIRRFAECSAPQPAPEERP